MFSISITCLNITILYLVWFLENSILGETFEDKAPHGGRGKAEGAGGAG